MPTSAADALRQLHEAERRNRAAVAARAAEQTRSIRAQIQKMEQEGRERARRLGEMVRARRTAIDFVRGPDGAWGLDGPAGGRGR